jgi:hypothetical protein
MNNLIAWQPLIMLVVSSIVIPGLMHVWSLLPIRKQQIIEVVVEHAVQAMEQIAKVENLSSEQKKQRAISFCQEALKAHGIHVSDTVISVLIESVVSGMNNFKAMEDPTKSIAPIGFLPPQAQVMP